MSPARQSQISILSEEEQISDVRGDGKLRFPSKSGSSSEGEVSRCEWFSKRIQFNAAGVGDLVRERGGSEGNIIRAGVVPAGTEDSAAGVPDRAAIVVHGDERGINSSGFGDVERRVGVVLDGDDLIDSEGVAVEGVVDV